MTARHLFTFALLPLFVFVSACSKKGAPAKVTGTVTYNGQPVTGGSLAFHTDAGVYAAVIDSQGKYSIADLPTGELVVTVDTESLNPNVKTTTYAGQTGGPGPKYGGSGGGKYPGAGGKTGGGGPSQPPQPKGDAKGKTQPKSPMPEDAPKGDKGTYVKIPRVYADKSKSTLKVTVKDGDQVIDLQLKD
ncbi:MAG: carboxypeptidase-like regulatory domain-containing protein [Planctomycetia bacterium]|nr:carboxypeptidase-like regulatory domain-containing protein [Planctomycetia bacterium]